MAVKSDNQIKLQDGHLGGYAEYGDLQGKPVLHFHGLPSSRLELHRSAIEQIAERLHARVIVVERPGIGLSDYHPYTIVSWPNIVTEFADALHLERFAVMGLSSGGKYVAACAWKIPDRLTAAGILNGSCPFDLPGAKETLSKEDRQVYHLATKSPGGLAWCWGRLPAIFARTLPAFSPCSLKSPSRTDGRLSLRMSRNRSRRW
jgi:pimeloyl-ACP methyl ester carboxylesterase